MFFPRLSPVSRRFVIKEIKSQRLFIVLFVALSVVAATLELVGVGLVFPFLLVLVQPDYIENFDFLRSATAALGIDQRWELYAVMVSMIATITATKNIFMGWFSNWQLCTLARWKTRLSERLMQIYLFSDFSIHMKKTTSEIIRNVMLTNMIYDLFFKSAIQIVVTLSVAAGLVGLLFMVLPAATVFATIVLLATAIGVYMATRKIVERLGEDSNVLYEKRQRLIAQSIGAIKEAKILGKEGVFVQKFVDVEARYFHKQSFSSFLQTLPYYISETVVVLSLLTVVLFETAVAQREQMALATLGLLAATMFRLAPQFNKALANLQFMNMSKDALEIISAEIEEYEETLYIPAQDRSRFDNWQRLEFRNVSYAYPAAPDKLAVSSVSFTIRRNEFIGITGPSGSGKSTLMMLLMGLLRPTSGEILLDGRPLEHVEDIRRWQNGIGYVPQGLFLIEGSLVDNVAYAADDEQVDAERVHALMRLVQMTEHIETKDEGVHWNVGESGHRLSGGQKQRVVIARALYHDPDLVAFDEATSALDVEVEKVIGDNLLKFKGCKTMVAIAHRLSTIRSCDKILFMQAGEVVDYGPFHELERRCPAFQRLVELSAPAKPRSAAA